MLEAVAALADASVATVERVAGDDAFDLLREAVAVGVVELVDDRIRFSHPLLAAAALEGMGPSRLRELHRRLADAVDDPDARARHLALAADGPDPAVAGALDEAARRAAGRGAPAQAAELSELAAGLTAAGATANRAQRLVLAGEWYATAGERARARELLRPLVMELPPGAARARVLLQLAHPNDDLDAAAGLCEQALREATGDDAVVAEANRTLHELDVLRGDTGRALEHARAAVGAAELAGDPSLLARCLGDASLVETWTGDVTPGWLERAVELERTVPGVSLYYAPTVILAIRLKYTGRLDEARTLLRDALGRTEATGDDPARIVVLLHLSDLECRAGLFAEAQAVAEAGVMLAEQAGDAQWQSALLSAKALATAHRGLAAQARAAARRGIELADQSGGGIFRLQNLGILGFVSLSEGDPVAAAAWLDEVAASGTGGQRPPGTLPTLPDAVEAFAATGELERVEALVAELELAGTRGHVGAAASALRGRGLLLAQALDLDGAIGVLEEAARRQLTAGLPFDRARTLLVLGSVLRRAKRKREARETLASAEAVFAALGAPLWQERALAELARIGGRAAAGGLTPTEAKIASLVAAGRTNREVAAELFVTVRTVESNLTRVYEKLGIRSRAELARRFVEPG